MICHNIFQNSWARAHFLQECTRVSVSPCHYQYLILSTFLIFAILMSLKRHVVVLFYFAFLWWLVSLNISYMLVSYLSFSFCELPSHILFLFLNWISCLNLEKSGFDFQEFLLYSRYCPLSVLEITDNFSQSFICLFCLWCLSLDRDASFWGSQIHQCFVEGRSWDIRVPWWAKGQGGLPGPPEPILLQGWLSVWRVLSSPRAFLSILGPQFL